MNKPVTEIKTQTRSMKITIALKWESGQNSDNLAEQEHSSHVKMGRGREEKYSWEFGTTQNKIV